MYVEDREGKGQVWKKREAVKEVTTMGHVPACSHTPAHSHSFTRFHTHSRNFKRRCADKKERQLVMCRPGHGRARGTLGEIISNLSDWSLSLSSLIYKMGA